MLWFRSESFMGFDVPSVVWFTRLHTTHCLLTASLVMTGPSCEYPCHHLGLSPDTHSFPTLSLTEDLPSFITTSVLTPEGCFILVALLDLCVQKHSKLKSYPAMWQDLQCDVIQSSQAEAFASLTGTSMSGWQETAKRQMHIPSCIDTLMPIAYYVWKLHMCVFLLILRTHENILNVRTDQELNCLWTPRVTFL